MLVHTPKQTYVVLVPETSKLVLKVACRYVDRINKIMGELDFSQDYFESDTMLLSLFGTSNLGHQFWPLLYGIIPGENNNFCKK